jgi:hypothetical protein
MRSIHAVTFFVCTVAITLTGLTQASADPSSQNAEVSTSDSSKIAAREEELRRKEAELLKAMGTSNSTPQDSKEIVEKTITVVETKQEVVVDKGQPTREIVEKEAQSNVELIQLKAIGSHPALESKKTSSTKVPNVPSAIKTHSDGQSRGDDTARRLDTFRRIDRNSSFEAINSYGSTRSRLVPIHEIESELSSRPQPIQDLEVATIGLRSAKLRTGPSAKNVTLLSLPEYSEVSIDYRSGEWYRIKTATGLRGWVQGRSLLFDAGISPRSTVKIGAVRAEPGSRIPR